MGDVPSDWEDPGQVPPQGVPPGDKDAVEEGHAVQVALSDYGRDNEGSGTRGGGDVFYTPLEYHFPVYRHLADTCAMSGGGEKAGGTDVDEMVGSGRTRPRAGRYRGKRRIWRSRRKGRMTMQMEMWRRGGDWKVKRESGREPRH